MVSKTKKRGLKTKQDFRLKNKRFWTTIVAVFLLSAVVILLNVNDSSQVTGQVAQKWGYASQDVDYAKAGSHMYINGKYITGLEEIEIKFSETIEDGKILMKDNFDIPFEGIVYSKFEVYSEDADKIGGAVLKFKLDPEKIDHLKMTNENVSFYVNGKELESTLDLVNFGSAFYTVTSPEIGEFVVGQKAE